jgi:hypothetical protein
MAVTIWLSSRVQRADGEKTASWPWEQHLHLGWLYKSGKLLPDSVYYTSTADIENGPSNHSQHPLPSQSTLKGDQNKVSDLLSFRDDPRRAHPLALIILPIVSWSVSTHASTVDSVRFQHLAPAQEVSSFLIQALQTLGLSLTQNKSQPRGGRQSVAPLDHLLRRSWSRL